MITFLSPDFKFDHPVEIDVQAEEQDEDDHEVVDPVDYHVDETYSKYPHKSSRVKGFSLLSLERANCIIKRITCKVTPSQNLGQRMILSL